jgi:HAE1 family hydrophobic/amphiphilic exporter-1
MNVSAWAIRKPIPSIVFFLLLLILGTYSFFTLGVDENPNIDIPTVSVIVTEVGAAPSELETQVTRKVEDAISGISNIKHIVSTITEGTSSTVVEFELGTNTDRATNDVRDAVTRIRQTLPQQIQEPQVTRLDFVGGPFVTYTVSGKQHSLEELSWLIDNDVARALLAQHGVGQVTRSGGVNREISVRLDPTKLSALGLTADDVNTQIRALNINLPGGRGGVGSVEQSIRALGSTESVEQLRALRIPLARGGWARLDQIGRVLDSSSEPRQAALLNGDSVVAFSIVRSSGSNMAEVADEVDKALDVFRKTLPPDIKIEKIRTNAKFVKESYDASMDSLVLGAGLAVVVIWMFLQDIRAALISAVAMPMSVIPTFAAMKLAGFTLNNLSMLGLSLVIGILVDDAIVEIENIVRHIHMGKKPYRAALEAADEIGLAVVATTMTIIVVFVPVAFMGGIPGQFFRQFGLTVAIAVFFSLLVARLITPMMAAYWMQQPPLDTGKNLLVRTYNVMLSWALAYRLPTVLLAVIFFVFSMKLFSLVPTSLIGNTDRGETVLSVELPPGAQLAETVQVSRRLTAILLRHREVKLVYAAIGTSVANGPGGGSSAGGINKANLYVVMIPKNERKLSQQGFEQAVREELRQVPGPRLSFGLAQGLSGKLKIILASNNPKDLSKAAESVLHDMRQLPGLYDVTSTASLERPEILVIPDVARAAEQGVSIAAIARAAQVATIGDIDQNLAKFDLPDRQINIRVQLEERYRNNLQAFADLRVPSASGALVPLGTVARVEMGQGPSEIDRYDRSRQVSIDANLATGTTLGDATDAVHATQALKQLPKDVREPVSGDAEIQRDVFTGFASAMGAAVLFIYAVLALLFGDFTQPLTIMVALPLSIGGAMMGLILSGESLGMYALIGIVMLMGLSTKNSILLVEYCLMSIEQGMSRAQAIMSAGEARMRPILMTTVAMIAGMVPIALGIGAGAEVRKAMAIAVIGGLITSTFLTLLVVPVVFTYVDDFRLFLGRFRSRREEDQDGVTL